MCFIFIFILFLFFIFLPPDITLLKGINLFQNTIYSHKQHAYAIPISTLKISFLLILVLILLRRVQRCAAQASAYLLWNHSH